ncbi:uncharacterized protein LOC127265985 [Andrographis paniculata]|uniref:uncharacterized protein LOC127265985 n=1 Tax=Andrographis paniculata TaxID=175694 RepID=UPI0021E919BC|nr:uncharacterized protein LOC127265985 [Andrographis paniculata]
MSMEKQDQALLQELDALPEERLQALECIRYQKKKVELTFWKHVRPQTFEKGDMVWKAVLLEGPKHAKLGKWSPTWERPFIISAKLSNVAYRLMEPKGEKLKTFINGKHLKRFYHSLWELEGVHSQTIVECDLAEGEKAYGQAE